MTPLKFDTLEFARTEHGKARAVIEGDLQLVLEALRRTGNSLGPRLVYDASHARPLIMCPMEDLDD